MDFSSLALYELQQLDDLFSECSVSTGGLSQLKREIPGYMLDTHHLLNCLITTNRRPLSINKYLLYKVPFPNTSDLYLPYMHSKHLIHLGKQCFLNCIS